MRTNNRKKILYFTVFLLVVISGTRYYLGGSDVYVYENVYNTSPSIDVVLRYIFTGENVGVNTNYEVGFIFICSLLKTLRFSYFGFILMFTMFFYALIILGLKRFVPNWSIFIATFMYKIMFYNTFISIRQGFTLAIFCYSLQFIVDKKIFKYFITCMIAFFIHRGALLLLPTKLIANKVIIGPILDKIIDIFGFSSKSDGWTEVTEPISIIHTIECYLIVL